MLYRCNICLKQEKIDYVGIAGESKNLLDEELTLLSVFASGSVMPFGELLDPTPTTEGISDLGESS